MLERTSWVDTITVNTVSFSSVIQIGDSQIINGLNRALAVQRETEMFYGSEGNFASFPIFREPIPLPPLYEPITFLRHQQSPLIKVNKIDIIAVSNSSMLHVGNTKHVYEEVRVMHERQLLPREEEVEG